MRTIPLKTLIASIIFMGIGMAMFVWAPSIEIAAVVAILLLTVFLFSFEVVGVDVAAVSIMVLLGLLSSFNDKIGLAQPLVPVQELFRGFSSNAVISIIAVMIIGAGLDKTGLMGRVAGTILKLAGKTEARVIPAVTITVGFISSFMQNVGAAALFLPVVSRISARTSLPKARLLMPMGFCAILGGTITMVGSSPLILLNDLIKVANKTLLPEQQMATWSLFSVTPIGIALLLAGIVYFVIAGRYVLPGDRNSDVATTSNAMDYFQKLYGLELFLFEVVVPANSKLAGKLIDEIEQGSKVRVIATLRDNSELRIGPGGLSREVPIEANSVLGILAPLNRVQAFVEANGLVLRSDLETFTDTLASTKAGIAEVIIPPGSELIGKSARELWMRKTYGMTLLALHRQNKTLREDDDVGNLPFQAGDVLVVHSMWEALERLDHNRHFLIIVTDYPHEELRPHKVGPALLFFGAALLMITMTEVRLSVALMTGAIGMILSGVLKMEEAYQAVSWKSVFLLASLIPLGVAVETSGTAAWIAERTMVLFGDVPIWVLQLVIALLATMFTLVMSNVGATVLLVPIAVNIAIDAGGNPAVFALIVALATSNSFFLPTHQVNALIMGPAGYRVADFMRAGGIMSILFVVVLMVMMNLFY
jgi:di/tricarboxylate transporter